MKTRFPGIVSVALLLGVAASAHAATISYSANFKTSKVNPIYDILILELDSDQQVHATIYPDQLPGSGTSAISRDVAYTPVKTLVIGLTEGIDPTDGSEKTQIMMLVNSAFAVANVGIPFSSIFPGTRHSTTIANLEAAIAGDTTQLAWFTDTFFPGPAAAAAFDSFGKFTVAEFTSLTIDGASASAGSWTINSAMAIPFTSMNAIDGRATEVIDESAKDTGPFDIDFTLTTESNSGQLAVDKTVTNNSGVAWTTFEMSVGTGDGPNFVPSANGDFFFVSTLNNHETTGAFPGVSVSGDQIVFTGFLAPGGTAHFVVFVGTTIDDTPAFTLRQVANVRATAPLLGRGPLAALAFLLAGVAWLGLRRRAWAGDEV